MQNEGYFVKTTNGVALAGLITPAWAPSLEQVAGVAGQLVPILSAVWLAIQIVSHLRRRGGTDDE